MDKELTTCQKCFAEVGAENAEHHEAWHRQVASEVAREVARLQQQQSRTRASGVLGP